MDVSLPVAIISELNYLTGPPSLLCYCVSLTLRICRRAPSAAHAKQRFGIERLISAYLEHLSALRSALALRGGGESRWPVFCTTYEHLTVRPRSESAALLQIEFLGHIADPAALNLSAVEVRASARTANCGADEIVPGHLGACEFAPHLLAKLANAIHRYHPTG